MYMAGFFPCMMFGIPGAALAIVQSAKPERRKVAIGLMGSAAICALISGVTEPFEFGFMFLAFPLYVAYSLLYGIFGVITTLAGFRAGFSFSGGAMDLLFSASLPAAAKTWLIIPLGLAAFGSFYAVFRFAIVRFDLKTPGREDIDEESGIDEAAIELPAGTKFAAMAEGILEAVGGRDNVETYTNCTTRLRLTVKDPSLVSEDGVRAAGAVAVVRPSETALQAVVGPQVELVADEFAKLMR